MPLEKKQRQGSGKKTDDIDLTGKIYLIAEL